MIKIDALKLAHINKQRLFYKEKNLNLFKFKKKSQIFKLNEPK
jgi:hypothetical protein